MRIESVTSMPCHRFNKGAGSPGRETYTTGLEVRNVAHSATSLTQASSTYCLVGRSCSPRGTADGAATRPMYWKQRQQGSKGLSHKANHKHISFFTEGGVRRDRPRETPRLSSPDQKWDIKVDVDTKHSHKYIWYLTGKIYAPHWADNETGMNGNRMQEQAQNPYILECCL